MLLCGEWYKAIVGFECVKLKIMWVKLKFYKVKVCVLVMCGVYNDRSALE